MHWVEAVAEGSSGHPSRQLRPRCSKVWVLQRWISATTRGTSLSDSSTEASADEEDADHEGEEGAMDSLDAWEPRAGLADELAGRELFRHGISRVIHLVDSEEGTHFVCRRVISTSYTSCARMPKILRPLCKQCFPTVA